MAVKQNYVTSEIKKKEKKLGKKITNPAEPNDHYSLDYTIIAANEQQKEIKFGDGMQFENDLVLQALGFKPDKEGVLKIPAFGREENTKTKKPSKASTKNRETLDARDM